MDRPRAGVHYPRSVGEFQAWFRTDADCLDYLEWLRSPGESAPTTPAVTAPALPPPSEEEREEALRVFGLEVESIPKLVETAVTSSSSGSGGGDAIGTTDPEFSLNRGTEQREVAVAE